MPSRPVGGADRVPAPALFLLSGVAQYLGAAVAVGLFASLAAPEVAWARIAVAAAVLLVWRRPWRARWSRRGLGGAVAFGITLAGMNIAFYLAIARLPLGTAVAIEFLGPVAVAAVTGRTWRERAGIAFAAPGVVLLAGLSLRAGPEAWPGVVAILVAALCWAGYILLGRLVASGAGQAEPVDGITALAVAMASGALVTAPALAARTVPAFADAATAALLVAVAVLSSVVPYAIEQIVLRRVSAASFAVMLAMLPATATVVGAVVLRQWPHGWEVAGLVLVSVAVGLTAVRGAPGRSSASPEQTHRGLGPRL